MRVRLGMGIALLVAGCSAQPVQPWEKGNLAKSIMQFDPDRLGARIDRQIHQSKEAATGGYMIGGGGCGCN